MNTRYFDLRHAINTTLTSLAADIAGHLQARQHLGKTVIICDKPAILLALTRKHWLRRSRALQKERSSTINAEKILRLTNTITHMHRMTFVARPPESDPRAHVFFITPAQAALLPVNTYSIYLTTQLNHTSLADIVEQLPGDALVTDYSNALPQAGIPLQPKSVLEDSVIEHWQDILNFLNQHHITMSSLVERDSRHFDAVDDALDTLLGISRQFLFMASNLQHALELAQPIALDNTLQRQYDILILLAHRVQALNPQSVFSTRFTYDLTTDDTFFLHDIATENSGFTQILAQTIEHHRQAGRSRLARALRFAHR